MNKNLKKLTNGILDVLRKNGFKDCEDKDDVFGYYFYLKNDMCEIYVRGENVQHDDYGIYYYEIFHKLDLNDATTLMGSVTSNNLSIYWLLGYLTYNGLMKKNYDSEL